MLLTHVAMVTNLLEHPRGSVCTVEVGLAVPHSVNVIFLNDKMDDMLLDTLIF